MSTAQALITAARHVLNDTSDTPRQTDAELLLYLNDGIKEVSALKPGLFVTVGDVVCSPDVVEYLVAFPDAQSLVRVLCIHNGSALTEFDLMTMDAFQPDWRVSASGSATQWARYPENVMRFFIHPPAPAVQTLDVMYVKSPKTLLIGDTITEVPAGVFPALVDYILYRASAKDDEHSDSGRAAAMYTAFVVKIKGG